MSSHPHFRHSWVQFSAGALKMFPGCDLKFLLDKDAEIVGSRSKRILNQLSLQDLEYANDMALIADSMDVLEEFPRF